MVGQRSHRPDVTSGCGGLMTNWCLRSITASTLPTPVGLLNGSILSTNFYHLPIFLLSTFLSLSLEGLYPPPPPPTPPPPTHPSVCLSEPEGGTVGV